MRWKYVHFRDFDFDWQPVPYENLKSAKWCKLVWNTPLANRKQMEGNCNCIASVCLLLMQYLYDYQAVWQVSVWDCQVDKFVFFDV